MGAIGNVDQYMKFQAADALRDAAQNEGSGGMGVQMGAGFAMGNQMVNAFGGGQQTGGTGGQPPQSQMISCPTCNKPNPVGTKFCGDCGGKMEVVQVPCVKCGANLREGAKFCNECGTSQEKMKCSKCNAEFAAGTKFCNECGTKTDA